MLYVWATKKEQILLETINGLAQSLSETPSKIAAENVVADLKQSQSLENQEPSLSTIIHNSLQIKADQYNPISGAWYFQMLSIKYELKDVKV